VTHVFLCCWRSWQIGLNDHTTSSSNMIFTPNFCRFDVNVRLLNSTTAILYRTKTLIWQRDRATRLSSCQYRKKLAIDEWPWHTLKVITDAAIKMAVQHIYIRICYVMLCYVMLYHFLLVDCCFNVFLTVFKTLPLLKWTWLPVSLRPPSFLTSLNYKPRALSYV